MRRDLQRRLALWPPHPEGPRLSGGVARPSVARGHQRVGHAAQREDVRAWAHVDAAQLLWRQEGVSPHDSTDRRLLIVGQLEELGDAEVQDAHPGRPGRRRGDQHEV